MVGAWRRTPLTSPMRARGSHLLERSKRTKSSCQLTRPAATYFSGLSSRSSHLSPLYFYLGRSYSFTLNSSEYSRVFFEFLSAHLIAFSVALFVSDLFFGRSQLQNRAGFVSQAIVKFAFSLLSLVLIVRSLCLRLPLKRVCFAYDRSFRNAVASAVRKCPKGNLPPGERRDQTLLNRPCLG